MTDSYLLPALVAATLAPIQHGASVSAFLTSVTSRISTHSQMEVLVVSKVATLLRILPKLRLSSRAYSSSVPLLAVTTRSCLLSASRTCSRT